MKITTRFENALAFAVRLYRHQFRKGGELPYIGHLLGVCSIALEHGADEDEFIAALLHDSIEDQAESFGGADKLRAHLRAEFGDKVLAIIEGCTDAETVPKPPWRERKERYIAHLAGALPSVLLVSASDKLYNARTILQTSVKWGTPCGRASTAAGKARSGTTGHCAMRSWRTAARRCAVNWNSPWVTWKRSPLGRKSIA